ncbi:MAG: ABC transporter ATP-binding protein [Frankia sp.]|nr:ABC transporter ATP-binding protein [Frankia sp.]
MLECSGLVRRFGDRVAVDHVGFRIAANETFGLLGPNGAGKTTTISMIAGILAPDEGEIRIAGIPMTTRAGAAKALVGLVPQDLALYPDLTILENLRFFGRLQQLPRRRLAARIAEVLEVVGLADRARDRVQECSGGMKRRANIAVGLLHEPKLLILDEPTVGIDPQSRNQILESIEQLGAAGMSVLYTTHYMEEAERLCDRIGIIDNGRLVAEGTRRELIERVGEQDRISVTASGPLAEFAAAVAALPGVTSAEPVETGLAVTAVTAAEVLAPLVAAGERVGVSIGSVQVVEPDLETVFLEVTGKALRD